MPEETKPTRFKVGEIAVYPRSGKRDIPVKILEVIEHDGDYFYRVDRKNAVSETMLRKQHEQEKGLSDGD